MKCKGFEIKVELEIEAVTCPGVWLCPNGDVTLHVYMLGTCIQTYPIEPIFPLRYHEKLVFQKTFLQCRKLHDIEDILDEEVFYSELIQWNDCKNGIVLATFKSLLTEVLYPTICGEYAPNIELELLMEPSKTYPGIISPKIELSTKTSLEEVLCSYTKDMKPYIMPCINPKVITSKCVPKRQVPIRQKKVCHSYNYHKNHTVKKRNKPTRKELLLLNFDKQDFLNRHSPNSKSNQKHRSRSNSPSKRTLNYDASKIIKPNNDRICECETKKFCPICTKYKYYFELDDSSRLKKCDSQTQRNLSPNKSCLVAQIHERMKRSLYVDQISPRKEHCCSNKVSSKREYRIKRVSPRKERCYNQTSFPLENSCVNQASSRKDHCCAKQVSSRKEHSCVNSVSSRKEHCCVNSVSSRKEHCCVNSVSPRKEHCCANPVSPRKEHCSVSFRTEPCYVNQESPQKENLRTCCCHTDKNDDFQKELSEFYKDLYLLSQKK